MHPILFKIGSFEVHSYGVILLLGFFVALFLARARAPRFGFDRQEITDLSFWTLIFGVAGARIVFVAQNWSHYSQNVGEIFTRLEGLTSFGGIMFGMAYVLFWAWRRKRSILSTLDVLGGPAMLGFVIGRVACLMNGCCHGGQCAPGAAFCVPVQGLPGLYFPAQLIDSVGNGLGLLLLLWIERRLRLFPGQSFALFLVLHNISRFVYEFWRAGFSSTYWEPLPITHAQAFALLLGTFGLGLFAYLGRKRSPAAQEATGV
jgi:phosphatidylglycerol---prolipoprotein diacylglyceryl transferase